MPTGRWLTTSATETRRGAVVVHQPERPGLAAARRHGGDVVLRERLARRGRHPQRLAGSRERRGRRAGSTSAVQRGAKTPCTVVDDVRQQLREA